MTKQIKVSFAESARHDLEEVLEYYKEHKVPHVGTKLISKVISEVELLADHPEIGRIVPEFEQDYLRELIRPPFRIVYRKDRKKIRVVRIWRSERLLLSPDND